MRYLANRDDHLYFALLTDFRDAPRETMPEDEQLLRLAREGVTALNEKYRKDRPNIFYLFHRPRRWNEREGVWMGYERKRGKLAEFNAVLRGAPPDRFSVVLGDPGLLGGIKYVISLDTDTQLPRDSARLLVGTMAHPLNHPKFDSRSGRVSEGYSILQPRVAISISNSSRSWYAKLFSGEPGLDPYTRAVSDVYQDVFQEGSFIGKGIYDVDFFVEALKGRFPENRILSHDLLESCYARSALVSDVQLYEEYPTHYQADAKRRHRWIRGDWQIATWLLPRVPGGDARRVWNPLTGLSRWKIFDNLRRSMVPIAMVLLLLIGWRLLPAPAGFWIGFALSMIIAPSVLVLAAEIVRKPREIPFSLHFRMAGQSAAQQFGQAFFTLAFLPYDALISFDAIITTLVRVLITKRGLLEWQTSMEAEKEVQNTLGGFYRTMGMAPALALATCIFTGLLRPTELNLMLPLLGLWLASPALAWWISRPLEAGRPELSEEQWLYLRRLARKTWRFFEFFVSAEENWLPPDNYQEHPEAVLASRTSPTNIGLYLLANLGAADFGYISAGQLLQRTENTLASVERFDRYRGHFYNWYNTRTLKPLQPLYISTVDNGNLAGHLLTLRPGLLECLDRPILPPGMNAGLRDTLEVLIQLGGSPRASSGGGRSRRLPDDLLRKMAELSRDLQGTPGGLSESQAVLKRVSALGESWDPPVPAMTNSNGGCMRWTRPDTSMARIWSGWRPGCCFRISRSGCSSRGRWTRGRSSRPCRKSWCAWTRR